MPLLVSFLSEERKKFLATVTTLLHIVGVTTALLFIGFACYYIGDDAVMMYISSPSGNSV